MNRLPIPAIGASAVIGFLAVLIVLVSLRPWAGPDQSANTLLNFSYEPPSNYTRVPMALVDSDPQANRAWRPATPADGSGVADVQARFVGHGCASCHGLTGEGGVVGKNLEDVSPSDIRKALKKGSHGMPVFSSLSQEGIDAIIAFLVEPKPPGGPGPAPALASEPVPASTPPPVTPAAPAQGNVQPAEPSSPPESASPTPPALAPTAQGPGAKAPVSPLKPTPEPVATPAPPAAASEPVASPVAGPAPVLQPEGGGPVSLKAVTAQITVDGDTSDWADIPATPVILQQIKPIPGVDMGQVGPVDASLRVAVDGERVFVLVEVADDYDYVPDDHGMSAAMAVMFRIDDPAAPHMGTKEENQRKSLGKVDIWHWELDCGPGVVSGGVTGIRGGNDPKCNFDDEYAKTPKSLEDDGSRKAENSLAGVWDHTGRAQGSGAEGTWIFEMSRPLQTGDPDDAQLSAGTTAHMALAYWDPDETPDGWTSEGHLQSATGGWIEVALP